MIHDLIMARRSILAFSSRAVEEEKLRTIFEAAQLAPSSSNNQPWRFIYATKENAYAYDLLFDCLMDGNKRWVKQAPVLILTIAETVSSYKNTPNKYAWHDTGLASMLLMLQAQALGLVTHPMGGFDHDKAKERLQIPEPYQPVAMIALGYHGRLEDLPDDLQKRESASRHRKPIDEIVFKGRYGNSWT